MNNQTHKVPWAIALTKGTVNRGNKRQRILFVVLLALLARLWGAWWYASTSTKDLLVSSTVLLNPGPLSQRRPIFLEGWLSEHEALCCVMYGYFTYNFFVLDTRTGQHRALPELTASQHKDGATPGWVSPNGRWILCFTRTQGDPADPDHADTWQYEINGNRVFHLRTPPDLQFVWATDSKSCLAWDVTTSSVVRWQVGTPGRCERRSVAPSVGDVWSIGASGNNVVFADGVMGAKEALIYELDWSAPAQKRALFTINHRHDSLIDPDMHLSSDGQRLAWKEHYSVKRPGPAWMQWVYRKLRMGSGDYVAIWTCRIDGTDQREIGHVQVASGQYYDPHYVGYWGWDYGGKGLWFEYDDKILQVPTE